MKKLIPTLATALCCGLFISCTQAQSIEQSFLEGVGSVTNWAVTPYGTYAPNVKSGSKFGGGVLAIYNVNQGSVVQAGLGVGLDWLGQWSTFSGNATISIPMKPFGGFVSGLSNIVVTPFILGGVATPMSGQGNHVNTSDVIAIAGWGLATDVYSVKSGWFTGTSIGIAGTMINRTSAGPESGNTYNLALVVHKGF